MSEGSALSMGATNQLLQASLLRGNDLLEGFSDGLHGV